VNITGTHFSDNTAGRNGGAVYFGGSNISITNSSFINNRANGGGGGAIYSARRYANISLVDNVFNRNTAAYCGVMKVAEFYHYRINIIGNTFIYNRAVQQIFGSNAGGVMCIRNASVFVSGNTFSHNSAAGDAGVIQADESDIIIERSIFSNNRAGGNGGVLHTYIYPTIYTIIDCSFINNQAGGDGGVMYVGRALSHVTISQGTFGFNYASNRGGVIAIIGSTLEMNGSSIFGNTAELGDVISACNSIATLFNLDLLLNQDPTYPFCSL
jgi:predicted outer membrane repeat protein